MAAVWTDTEIAALRGMLATGTAAPLIARKLGRSEKAVVERARRLKAEATRTQCGPGQHQSGYMRQAILSEVLAR